jgi:cephalosporin hydroxylase
MKKKKSINDNKQFLDNINLKSYSLGKNKSILKYANKFLCMVDKYDYPYLWTWMGFPIIQLPADILVNQEIIFKSKPDIIIETGVARGGSLIFYASILKMIKKSFKVIGIEVDMRSHNKALISKSPLSKNIKIVEGSSIDELTLKKVKKYINKKNKVLVILDSNHTKRHVLKELNLYSNLVTKKSYLIVADTTIGLLNNQQIPRKRSIPLRKGDEPLSAVYDFLKDNRNFKVDSSLNGKLVFSSNFNGYLKKY